MPVQQGIDCQEPKRICLASPWHRRKLMLPSAGLWPGQRMISGNRSIWPCQPNMDIHGYTVYIGIPWYTGYTLNPLLCV